MASGKFYKLSHARMFSRPKILFLVSLLFVALLNPKFNPYLLFKFLIFYHSSMYIQFNVVDLSVSFFISAHWSELKAGRTCRCSA